MIVRDEENTLTLCLNSVKDIVDQMVIVDTGSKDKTIQIAKNLGADVHQFQWCDSFAEARNESIKYANGDWILWMDADETLDPSSIAELKKITQEVNGSGGKCKASLISPGFVDTNIDMFFEQPTVVEKTAMMWEICKEAKTILSPNAVFDAVKFVIDSYEKGNLVTHIVINN